MTRGVRNTLHTPKNKTPPSKITIIRGLLTVPQTSETKLCRPFERILKPDSANLADSKNILVYFCV